MKKGLLPPIIAMIITVIAVVWTSKSMASSGFYQASNNGLIKQIITISFLSFVGTVLWCSIVSVVVILPLSFLLFGKNLSRPDGEILGVLFFFLITFIMFLFQYIVFGSCTVFYLM